MLLRHTVEKVRRVNHLKNEVYCKVFQALYWIAKEELPSLKKSYYQK